MEVIKKFLGLIWMLLGPAAVIFLSIHAYENVKLATDHVARINTALQWGIILFIFIPVSAGLVIFGYYALKGEYKKLPGSSEEI